MWFNFHSMLIVHRLHASLGTPSSKIISIEKKMLSGLVGKWMELENILSEVTQTTNMSGHSYLLVLALNV